MTDIHCHLLQGIDDGSKSIEESIEVLKDLKKIGYDNIILTPHYIKDSKYTSSRKNNYKRLKELRSAVKESNIDINLYLGNEIYIDEDIYELLKSGVISTLNGTRYTLIELPMSGEYEGYKDIFNDLINGGCKIVLAHPERYMSFQNDFNKIYELKKMGIYFQCNIESITGKYGHTAQKTIHRMLKEHLVSFLATDTHRKRHDYTVFKKAREEALKIITAKEYDILVNKNPSVLVQNDFYS